MSFSYQLSTSPSDRDWVRLRIGDTSSGSNRLEDEEIDALLDGEGSKYIAAAVAAETIGAGLAQSVDKTVGKLSISKAKASENYFRLAKRLRSEAGMRAGIYAGGLSRAEKQSDAADTDLVRPSFTRGEFDHPASLVDFSTEL